MILKINRPFSPGRRNFVRTAAVLGASAALPAASGIWGMPAARAAMVSTLDPIQSLPIDARALDFNGDDIHRSHDWLWNKDEFIAKRGGLPRPERTVSVAVVGGGIAGLTAAYTLRDERPWVLEGAAQLGGNSKGETWGGSTYATGAAYITRPDEGSDIENYLRELGLREAFRADQGGDWETLLSDGSVSPVWKGELAPVLAQLQKIREEAFPDIPPRSGSPLSTEALNTLDRRSFEEWMRTELAVTSPRVVGLLREYCWSSFGADPVELSAAQALNFIAGDLGGTIALPGGNAGVARELTRRLHSSGAHLEGGALVIDVRPTEGGVQISFEDSQGRFRSILAARCVVALPKLVARIVVSGLGADQDAAMRQIKYRAYLTANVLVRGRIPSRGYDLYAEPARDLVTDPRRDSELPAFTDLIFANWANGASGGDQAENSVLTLYRPLPYSGAEQFLFSPDAAARHRARVESALTPLLGAWGIAPSRVHDIRQTRLGHAIPIARTGLWSSGALSQASAPFAGRIFFCNQDNFANPCFESAAKAAWDACKFLKRS